jgi:hypothetical protein
VISHADEQVGEQDLVHDGAALQPLRASQRVDREGVPADLRLGRAQLPQDLARVCPGDPDGPIEMSARAADVVQVTIDTAADGRGPSTPEVEQRQRRLAGAGGRWLGRERPTLLEIPGRGGGVEPGDDVLRTARRWREGLRPQRRRGLSGLLDGGSAGDQREDDRGQGEPQRDDERSGTPPNAHRAERRQPGK